MPSRAGREHEAHQRQGHEHVHFAQQLDAAVDAAGHGEIRDDGHDGDEAHHIQRRVGDAVEPGDASHGLLRPQPQRSGETEQRGKHRENVDGIAGASPHGATKQRVKR